MTRAPIQRRSVIGFNRRKMEAERNALVPQMSEIEIELVGNANSAAIRAELIRKRRA